MADDANGASQATVFARINNVAPVIADLGLTSAVILENGVATLTGRIRIWPRTTSLDCACELRSFAG
jgi:hypothetical protein